MSKYVEINMLIQRRNQRESKKYLETNANGNKTDQNLRDTAKELLIRKLILINAITKKGRS